MKTLKVLLVCFLLLSVTAVFGAKDNKVTLVSSSPDVTVLNFETGSYHFKTVKTINGTAKELVAPDTGKILEKGVPGLAKLTASVIVPDEADMQVQVIDSTFTEIKNIDIAPSKGNILRTVNPDDVPYEYGEAYGKNEFYPTNLAVLGSAYIARDFRGQTVAVNPFRYNPVTKVLRVYSSVTVQVSPTGAAGENTFNRTESISAVHPDFEKIYESHFINYSNQTEYTTLPDGFGNMLIVCYNGFMADMAEFVS